MLPSEWSEQAVTPKGETAGVTRQGIAVYLFITYVAAGIVALVMTIWFFTGVTSVPDSFLTNLITVDAIAAGIMIIVVPISVRKLGTADSILQYFILVKDLVKGTKKVNQDLPLLVSRILSNSLGASTLLIPIGTISSFGLSVIFSLYSILHGYPLTYSALAFAFLIAGVALTAGLAIALFVTDIAESPRAK